MWNHKCTSNSSARFSLTFGQLGQDVLVRGRSIDQALPSSLWLTPEPVFIGTCLRHTFSKEHKFNTCSRFWRVHYEITHPFDTVPYIGLNENALPQTQQHNFCQTTNICIFNMNWHFFAELFDKISYRITIIQFKVQLNKNNKLLLIFTIAVEQWSFYVVVFNKIRYIVYFIIKVLLFCIKYLYWLTQNIQHWIEMTAQGWFQQKEQLLLLLSWWLF